MLNFAIFRVPVSVDWWFWLTTILLGGGASARDAEDWMPVMVWTLVVFVSILVHEMGHAFSGRHFGALPSIRLHGFGGVTFLPGARFSRPESIAVSAAGPAAGLLLGGVVTAVERAFPNLPPLAQLAMRDAVYVNFFWTLVNLLPIQPLDGGQILSQLLGPSRARVSSAIGFIVASLVCLWALSHRMVFLALMLAMLAFHNFRREPVEGGVITP